MNKFDTFKAKCLDIIEPYLSEPLTPEILIILFNQLNKMGRAYGYDHYPIPWTLGRGTHIFMIDPEGLTTFRIT